MTPPILYKYRYFDKDGYQKRTLTHDELFFSSARRFNDPFDGIIPENYDLLSDAEYLEMIKGSLRVSNPKMGEEDIDKTAREQNAKGLRYNSEYQEKWYRWQIEYKYDNFGIFSVSEFRDNILMWSHYSDCHRGFCLGFDTVKLDSFCREWLFRSRGELVNRYPIEYSQDWPKFHPKDIPADEAASRQLTTKSQDWDYEREHRYILMGKVDKVHRIEDGILRTVILGAKMPEEQIEEIKQALRARRSRVDLLKSRIAKGKFALEFEDVDY